MSKSRKYNVSANSIRKTIGTNILKMCKLPIMKKCGTDKNGNTLYKLSTYSKDSFSLKMTGEHNTKPTAIKVHAKGEPRLMHIVTKAQYIKYFQKPIREAVATAVKMVDRKAISNFEKPTESQSQNTDNQGSAKPIVYKGVKVYRRKGHYFIMNGNSPRDLGSDSAKAKQAIDRMVNNR